VSKYISSEFFIIPSEYILDKGEGGRCCVIYGTQTSMEHLANAS